MSTLPTSSEVTRFYITDSRRNNFVVRQEKPDDKEDMSFVKTPNGKLKHVNKNWSNETERNELLEMLPEYIDVTELTVFSVPRVTTAFLSEILQYFPNLLTLKLFELPRANNVDFFKSIHSNCSRLKTIKFYKSHVSSNDIKTILSTGTVQNLEFVTCQLPKSVYQYISKNLTLLKSLTFQRLSADHDDMIPIVTEIVNNQIIISFQMWDISCGINLRMGHDIY
jgi:hypothetical protein